jgi:hypothetical protein
MVLRFLHIACIFTLLFTAYGFVHSEPWISNKNLKKADRAISKIWPAEAYSLESFAINYELMEQADVFDLNGTFYMIQSGSGELGMAYIGLANGCHIGGCENPLNPNNGFENFDFLLIYDTEKNLLHAQVLRYDCEYGYEICGRRWLKQFIGDRRSFDYGSDIQAIAGATVSARSITYEISKINKIVINQ